MNLYEAIFVRKTVRKYKTEPLEQSTLDNIMDFADNTLKLFEGIIVEYKIMNHSDMKKNFSGALTYRAPHYLTLYSENVSGYQMNAVSAPADFVVFDCERDRLLLFGYAKTQESETGWF